MQNAVRVIADLDPPALATTPSTEVWSSGRARLIRYNATGAGAPVVLIPSLVTTAALFDLRPATSIVGTLARRGRTVYLLDWGIPDQHDAGNGLDTYADDYIPATIAAACNDSG